MNQQTSTNNKTAETSKSNQTDSGKKEATERQLDKELDMTFPASDPPAITQPGPDKKQPAVTPTKSNNTEPASK